MGCKDEGGPDLQGAVDFWWTDMSAIEKIYWLSREPEFLEDMWSVTWSQLFSTGRCDCCDGQIFTVSTLVQNAMVSSMSTS